MGDVVYRDQVVVSRVVTGDVRRARRFHRRLTEELQRELRQEEILIVEKRVEVL